MIAEARARLEQAQLKADQAPGRSDDDDFRPRGGGEGKPKVSLTATIEPPMIGI